MKKKLLVLMPSLLGIFLFSCAGDTSSQSSTNESKTDSVTSSKTDIKDSSSKETKMDFTNVSFESVSFVYDAKAHILP